MAAVRRPLAPGAAARYTSPAMRFMVTFILFPATGFLSGCAEHHRVDPRPDGGPPRPCSAEWQVETVATGDEPETLAIGSDGRRLHIAWRESGDADVRIGKRGPATCKFGVCIQGLFQKLDGFGHGSVDAHALCQRAPLKIQRIGIAICSHAPRGRRWC